LDHRWTPKLPTCVVARNSSEGENAIAVAIVGSRRAEIRNPVGRSQTRNVESRATDIIHVDVGEKIFYQFVRPEMRGLQSLSFDSNGPRVLGRLVRRGFRDRSRGG